MHHRRACVVAANWKKPSARIQALSCPKPLRRPPFGPDLGSILPGPPSPPTHRPGFGLYPARTRAAGGPDEPPKLVRILRQPPLSVLSGGGAPVPSDDINCSPSSWTRSEPPRLVMRGGESPRIVSPTHPLSLVPSHHTSLRTHTTNTCPSLSKKRES